MKFIPTSSAACTARSASPRSTCRNSCPSDDAPKLSTGSFSPVFPSSRYSIEIRRGDRRLQATGESPLLNVGNCERSKEKHLRLGTVPQSPPDVPDSSWDTVLSQLGVPGSRPKWVG